MYGERRPAARDCAVAEGQPLMQPRGGVVQEALYRASLSSRFEGFDERIV